VGINVSRDEAARFSGNDPEMTEGLEMRFIVQDCSWKDRIESTEEGSDCYVGSAEGIGATSKEEGTDGHMSS
jgi:hypothetical protein